MLKKIIKFFKEMNLEIKKITWPKRKDLWESTWVVVIFSIILTIFVWVIDLIFSRLLIGLLR